MPNANTNKLGTTGKVVDGALTVENGVFYDRNLLKRLKETLVWAKYAQKRNAPKRSGDTVSFRSVCKSIWKTYRSTCRL